MFASYVTVAVIAASMNIWAASEDFRRTDRVTENVARAEIPPSWLFPLGALKFAGAVGLVVGIFLPLIGLAAAVGLVLFFVCAVFAHLRVRWYSTLPYPIAFLLLAVIALAILLHR